MAVLHLICGLPGAGKSTFALALEKESAALLLSADAWMVEIVGDPHDEPARDRVEACQSRLAFRLLERGVDVILENGFWVRAERDGFRARAAAVGARVRLYYLDADLATLQRRVAARNAALPPGGFHVPPQDLAHWFAQFEPPTPDEDPVIIAPWENSGQRR